MSNRNKAAQLSKIWGLNVKQSRYSDWGNFYGLIKSYPAILLDSNGYLYLESPAALDVSGIKIGKRINVPDGISSLRGYVRMAHGDRMFPEEVPENEPHYEGAVSRVTVNKYERDRDARDKCIAHYGTSCSVCGFRMEDLYGEIAHDFIHVHHLVSLSSIGEKYVVDPIKDLRPVCPNCHAIIHRQNPPLSLDELRDMMASLMRGDEKC